ncbi:MAG: Gfo/Idh/MocA family protein [Candidatus Promineifilaceae bacterium]
MTDKTIKWGILGPGSIAHKFAIGLQLVPNAELVAVGSRSLERAQAFAAKFDALSAYGSYADLIADPDVDAIYVGTPHSFHKTHSILCMDAGKHVLCEKPFAINANEARAMAAAAQRNGVVLMEAMWSRFLPTLVKVRELLAAGVIGEVRMISADFGFRTRVNPEGRLFDPSLGGGALLDVGIYPLSLAYMIFGKPTRIASMADIGSTGIDEQSAFILGYEGGQMAICSTAVRTNTPHEATIMGSEGMIKLHAPWWVSATLSVNRGGDEEIHTLPFLGNGYTHEAIEVGNLIRSGKLESDVIPLAESIQIMETMDALRAEWGIKYPME